MHELLQLISFIGSVVSLTILIIAYKEVSIKRRAFTITPWLAPLGIFVWADALVIGFFWLLWCSFTFFWQDWWFFMSGVSAFWLVRSLGEVNYWMLQQFLKPATNEPHKLWGNRFHKGDDIWIAYQVAWQCVAVVSLLSLAYSAYHWLFAYM
jgi:hypothetical protein